LGRKGSFPPKALRPVFIFVESGAYKRSITAFWFDRALRAFGGRGRQQNMDPSNHEIATTWLRYGQLSRGERPERLASDALSWASQTLYQLVRDNPERAWKVIELLLKLDSSEIVLANVAAGPVEDLLVHHGAKFIDRVEQATVSDPVFKKMLGAVWKNNIPADIWNRVKAVAGPSF
jgi:hypothetical protein